MKVFAFIGVCVVALFVFIILKEIFKFIQRVFVRKYKIKAICKHEYIPYLKWYNGEHGIEYVFKCRKCGKGKAFKTYQKNNDESVF